MELNLTALETGAKSALQGADAIFAEEYNEPLIHQLVTTYLAGARAGTKAQKTRAQVRGGGRKPWRQKGTGRARAGSSRSPLWRGGGIIFAATPRDFTKKINKKMYRKAIRAIWAELNRAGRLMIVDNLTVDAPKTKLLLQKLQAANIDDALIVTHDADESLYLAARNLYTVEVRDVCEVDPVALLSYENVVMTVAALRQLEEVLGQ